MAGPPVEILRQVPLFEGLDDATLTQLSGDFSERQFAEGAEITTEGVGGLNFFVVETGDATVTVGGSQVGTLGPGDSFGEIALVDKAARAATITATTAVRAWALPVWSFRSFVETRPDVAWKLLEILADRLRAAQARSSPALHLEVVLGDEKLLVGALTSAITSTYGSSPEPFIFAFSRPSTWKRPDELFMRISMRTGLLLAVADPNLVDCGGGDRVHRDASLLERDSRPTLRHVERISDPKDPCLERERLAVGAVARDRLEDLRHDHGAVGLVVEAIEQLVELRRGEEQAPVLMAAPMDGHPDAVGERREDDHDLGVLLGHPVVAHDRRLDAVLRQLPQELQSRCSRRSGCAPTSGR